MTKTMKRQLRHLIVSLMIGASCITTGYAKINYGRALSAIVKGYQAYTLSEKDLIAYVKQSVAAMDRSNNVAGSSDPYTIRLNRLTNGLKSAGGVPLNFKVYKVKEANAFACADGSVRVFSALMDIMDDNELMGVIGHEIGHVIKKHSLKEIKHELTTGAIFDAISATGGTLATLTDSQLGSLGEVMLNARYSRKQENEADDCGYEFLVKNGRNPWGMAMSFEKLKSLQGNQSYSKMLTNMFSSHPDLSDRISRMSARARKDGYSRPGKSENTNTVKSTPKSTSTSKSNSGSKKKK